MVTSNDALEQLISQFAQPLSFLRELVQNSLDAESTEVEITVDLDSDSGQIFIRVEDNGLGMTEEIIDSRLTRLFSSTKEDDFTKIGKFGIGFVSIFAIKPELVVLETGCSGESWRVIFKPDRSFEKRKMRQLVEGTRVTLFLPPGPAIRSLSHYQDEARSTVAFWCKYAATEILFNGVRLNQEFGIPDSNYQYHYVREGTEVVLAPSSDPVGFQGYYNRGLTLMEGRGSPIPHLNFRMRSRYLEHTLSRDNILHDENYQKAVAHLEQAACREMPLDLFKRLASQPEATLWESATYTLKIPGASDLVKGKKVVPSFSGLLSIRELSSELLYWGGDDAFRQAVEELGRVQVIETSADSPLFNFLHSLGKELVSLQQRYLLYQKVSPDEDDERVLRLLLARAPHLKGPFLARVESRPDLVPASRIGYFLNPAQRVRSVQDLGKSLGASVAILSDSPLYERLKALARLEPELALSVLVRKLHLDLGLGKKKEQKLLADSLLRLKAGSEAP